MKTAPIAHRETIAILSTAHITAEVAAQLDGSADQPAWLKGLTVWPPREYGFLLHVAPLDEPSCVEAHAQLPECLRACFDVARADGADWLMLDRDQCEIPDLPIYEW